MCNKFIHIGGYPVELPPFTQYLGFSIKRHNLKEKKGRQETMNNYYADKLNAQSLLQVYDTAIPRIKQYLDAEIDFVRQNLTGSEDVLELAAGYGRIVKELAPSCASILGMDISAGNVELGKRYLADCPNASMVVMDAHKMQFGRKFHVVLCLQNALSAMRADLSVINQIISLLEPGGTAYFSSYSSNFWAWRLKWFEEQAEKGLLGEIDYEQTKDGVIVCKDGFRAVTHTPQELSHIGELIGLPYEVREVDGSSVFLITYEISKQK